jgi:hypothetical protein
MMNARHCVTGVAAAAVGFVSGQAFGLQPMAIDIGPVKFAPTVKLGLGYDDNIYAAPSGEEKGSFVARVAPTFNFRAQERRNIYELRYGLLFEGFEADGNQNHLDHDLLARSRLALGARSELELRGAFVQETETLDEVNRRFDEDANINQRYGIRGIYRYGREKARGQIEMDAGYVWNRYENNLKGGSNNRSQEYDSPRISGTFLWRVAPKTQALFEIGYEKFDYTWSQSQLDSYNLSYLAGVTWEATGKTTGIVKVGYEEKDFDDSSIEDQEEPVWEASIIWRPNSRADITAKTFRDIAEGGTYQNVTKRDGYVLRWDHDWTSRISSDASIDYVEEDYIGSAYDGREDKITAFSLGLGYSVTRWLDLGIQGRIAEDDSNLDTASYDRNTVFVTANISL